MSKTCYRYLLTRLENNEPTITSLEQTIEDIKAVLAASDIAVPAGLAKLHEDGTLRVASEGPTGIIETILIARSQTASQKRDVLQQ